MDDFIQHFGVKGMKWGVTRDSDAISRAATDIADSGATKLRTREDVKKFTKISDDAKKAKELRAKSKVVGVHTLSNKDLQDVVSRMNLEVQYKNLKQAEFEMTHVGKGKKWAARFVTDVAKNVATSWLSNPFASGKRRDPYRTQAWANGQDFSRTINGSVGPVAIGN